MKKLMTTILFLSLSLFIFSQDKVANPRHVQPYNFKLGPTINLNDADFSVDAEAGFFINPKMELTAKTGTAGTFCLGMNYHFNAMASLSRLTPFLGVKVGNYDTEPTLQFPVGINYISRKGFTASAAISNYYFTRSYSNYSDIEPFLEFRFGWSFAR